MFSDKKLYLKIFAQSSWVLVLIPIILAI
jgi:hypothetical protein